MKHLKGEAGYIHDRKKQKFTKAARQLLAMLVFAVQSVKQTGIMQIVFIVITILCCLPLIQTIGGLWKVISQHSISKSRANDIEEKAKLLTRVYDVVFASQKNCVNIDCLVISKNTVFGYSSKKKIDTEIVSEYIKQHLLAAQLEKITVKVFDNYTAFLTRAEGLNNIMAIEKADSKDLELYIKESILQISL